MSLKHQIARKKVLNTGLEILEHDLVIGTWGNISVRIPEDDLIVITPTGVAYKELEPDYLPIMDLEGNRIDGTMTPSVELPLHLGIYKAREDVFAIVHTHSVYCTAMAIARKGIPASCEDMIFSVGGSVDVANYEMSGTPNLAKAVVKALGRKNAVLMANHGLITVGKTLGEAVERALICEKSAHATLLAAGIGGAVALNETQCEDLLGFYAHAYGQKEND